MQKRKPRIPLGKTIRVEAMLLDGYSQRDICRELHLSHHSVRKIIKSEDFQNFLKEQRERLFAIAPIAIESLRAGVATDPRLAFAFLRDLGIVPEREAMLNLTNPTPPQMTSEEDLRTRVVRGMASVMLERHEVFGLELPAELQAVIEKENAVKLQRH